MVDQLDRIESALKEHVTLTRDNDKEIFERLGKIEQQVSYAKGWAAGFKGISIISLVLGTAATIKAFFLGGGSH